MKQLPRWLTVCRKLHCGSEVTALEAFIFNHQPSSSKDVAKWRKSLSDAIKEQQ